MRYPTDISMTDCTQAFAERIADARAAGKPLYIQAGNSKRLWLGRTPEGETLDVSSHTGIVDYQPSELVITARAGTTIAEIDAATAKENQYLACEPPRLSDRATLGGSLACNLSGPGRPWAGALRDHVLGVQLINGKAECLNFGGQVMKNVAGYDVSRLQAGALGTLGLITQVSMKVLPKPEATTTLCFELNAADALQQMQMRAMEPRPLSGAAWLNGVMFLRLSGAEAAVRHTEKLWGGERDDEHSIWLDLQELSFLSTYTDDTSADTQCAPVFRQSVAPTAPLADMPPLMLNWAGAQRWYEGDCSALRTNTATGGGHLQCFSGGNRSQEMAPALDSTQQTLHRRVKAAMDPDGILNPGRLYSWL
ncbi:MAG: glycolate oxidase subunit GlcE [Halioglobus sp.]